MPAVSRQQKKHWRSELLLPGSPDIHRLVGRRLESTVTTRLSRQQLKQYDGDGIVFPVTVFSVNEIALFRVALESIADNGGEGRLKRFDSLHLFFGWAHRLVTHEALLRAAEDILGEDILIDGTLVLYKPPHDSSYVSW